MFLLIAFLLLVFLSLALVGAGFVLGSKDREEAGKRVMQVGSVACAVALGIALVAAVFILLIWAWVSGW